MKRFLWVCLMVMLLFCMAFADNSEKKARIEINIPSRTLSFYKGDELVKRYPVCVGKPTTPTPTGSFKVIYKAVNPHWLHDGKIIPPGPKNPLGIRWIGIADGIGIHGNNQPQSIGTLASAGCIRMYNKDVAELYAQVPVGTPVRIIYECVEVFEDPYGKEKAAVVFPDSYKAGGKYGKELLQEPAGKGLGKEQLDRVQDLLKASLKAPAAAALNIGIFLNNRFVTGSGFYENGAVFISYQAARELLGLSPEFLTGYQIATEEKNGIIFIDLSGSAKVLGWDMHYDEKSAGAYLKLMPVKINGVYLAKNLGNDDTQSLIDTKSLKSLGYPMQEDEVDLMLFGSALVKVQREKKNCIGIDPLLALLNGEKRTDTLLGIVDAVIPVRLKKDGKYYDTVKNHQGVFISGQTAEAIKPEWALTENTEAALEALNSQEGDIPLETFLAGMHYRTNEYNTVIEILEEGDSEAASN